MIGGIPFQLASQKQLQAIGAGRAWNIQWLEDSTRRLTGTNRNSSQTKDTVEFVYRWELADYGYGDSEDIRERRYDWGYGDGTTPMRFVCPPKITTITLTGATANCTSIIQATNNGTSSIYAAAGRYIYVISPTDDSIGTIDCGAGIVAQDLAIFEDYIYIAMLGSPMKRYGPLSSGGTLSAAHATLTFSWFLVANETLWGVQPLSGATAGLLRKVAAGAAGSAWTASNWNAGDYVGYAETNINKPMNLGVNIFMGKPEGFFTYDSAGEVKQLMPDMAGYLQALNFQHGMPWRGRLYLPHETGLVAYSRATDTFLQVGPETHELNTSAIKGFVREVIGVGRFLYCALEDSSGHTYICKGYPAPISAKEPFAWHPLTKVTSNVCRSMYYSNLTDPRLWFGNDYNISYYRMGATLTYESGQINFPAHDGGYPFDDKILEKGAVEGGTPTGTTMGLYYTLDGGTERTVGASMTVGSETSITTNNVGKRVSPRVALNAKSDNLATPTLRAISLTGIRRPSTRGMITAHIVAADSQYQRSGQLNNLTAAQILSQLRTWAAQTSSITVVDPNGTSRSMMMMPEFKEDEIGILDNRAPEIVATVTLRA